MLSRTAGADATLMERISELANEVYAVAEAGLWTDGATRTSVAEIVQLTRVGQIAVARMGGQVVGCVRVQRLDERTGEFGMLCADPAHRGIGIGLGNRRPLPVQSGYSSLRQVRGSGGWTFGVRSSRKLKYGATNGSGAITV
jgi:GNAT superfamily N-acetyltransferase